jgi:hypothetical protein
MFSLNKFNNLFLLTVHEKYCQNFSSTESMFTMYGYDVVCASDLG